jgi:hypothetical protein
VGWLTSAVEVDLGVARSDQARAKGWRDNRSKVETIAGP